MGKSIVNRLPATGMTISPQADAQKHIAIQPWAAIIPRNNR